MFPRLRIAAVTLPLLFHAASAHAAWSINGNAVCTAINAQTEPTVVGDASGGALIVWRDTRSGGGLGDVYAQHLDTNGNLVAGWVANGLPLESLATTILTPTAVSDGAGGAIAVWRDGRGGLYAQRVSGAGATQWPANGVRVANVVVTGFEAIADGAGGVIVAWEDNRGGPANHEIYARRVNATGDTLWAPNGVAVCTAPGHQVLPSLVSDGAAGAIIAWVDGRVSVDSNRVYVQRILAAGTAAWTVNGRLAGGSETVFHDQDLGAAIDGSGGVFVVWTEYRGFYFRIFLQHLTSSGAASPGWPATGTELEMGGYDTEPSIVPDGAGGCVVAGAVFGSELTRVMHLSGAGADAWTQDFYMPSGTDGPSLVRDGTGGGYVAYLAAFNTVVSAGRATGIGTVPAPWTNDGVPICSATGTCTQVALAATTSADAVAAWTDTRNVLNGNDIYAVKLGGANPAGAELPGTRAVSIAAHPNPVHGALIVRFALAGEEPATLDVIDLAGRVRATREVGTLGAGWHTVTLNETRELEPGVYFLTLRRAGEAQSLRFAVVR